MFELNNTYDLTIQNHLFDMLSNLYIGLTVTVILIGLVGNFFIITMYSFKKNRTNSSHVFLLCSAIVDNSFLFIQLIEVNINIQNRLIGI